MAHHQLNSRHKMLATNGISSSCHNGLAGTPGTGEDESAADLDEPPDHQLQFVKMKTPSFQSSAPNTEHDDLASPNVTRDMKESLLTQALLSSPDTYPMSETELPVLTSDGGLTSPARTTTPSPPPPSTFAGLSRTTTKEGQHRDVDHVSDALQIARGVDTKKSHETNIEAGLGRRRCVSFACGRQSTSQKTEQPSAQNEVPVEIPVKDIDPPKRPCMLRFACPMKPLRTSTQRIEKKEKSPSPLARISPPKESRMIEPKSDPVVPTHCDSDSTIRSSPSHSDLRIPMAVQSRKGRTFNRIDFQKCETTRFHEFACNFSTDDEWTNEQTAYRHKITVNDTLRKENAIRKLAEEAEEEALDEEDEGELLDDVIGEDDASDNIGDVMSDDGNETDDEEGFGASDDESDGDSDYQFWTPGQTTAATSTDHLEHIRPIAHRVASDSSIESTINLQKDSAQAPETSRSHLKSPRMRPRASELPDSSDFVVGTVDEDRPLEEAYMSCLEKRRRSRHKLIPQDIDPSFPTSEPEANDENENDDGSEDSDVVNTCMIGHLEISEEPEHIPRSKNSIKTQTGESSIASPKRLQSPSPVKRIAVHRSPPPPRRLFGQSTHRLRSPPPMHRKLTSPPSSRRPSTTGSPTKSCVGVNIPHLAQRPNLTHTTSLPRTPNPFWNQHRRACSQDTDSPLNDISPGTTSTKRSEIHSRGPIDIVQGLETKRQRRKDKYWRQHCRTVGKEKHQRCQPGKGAERMKELGLEMADRFRGYGQRAQLVLSV